MTTTEIKEYIGDNVQHQSRSPTFLLKSKSLLSATSVRRQRPNPMTLNTIASMDKLTCTNYVDFEKCQDKVGWFFWSIKYSNYLVVKLKVFEKDDNRNFRVVQNLTLEESDFKQFLRLRNQLVFVPHTANNTVQR